MSTNITRITATLFGSFLACLASAQVTNATLSLDGKPVVVFAVPPAAKVASTNGYLNVQTANLTLYIWAVPGAKSVADALPHAGEIIKSEFLNFKTNSIADLSLAGTPAKHVLASGNEADDHDPGNAEVVLFEVGGHVIAACVHGEADEASKARAAMLAVLKTLRAPP